MISLSLSEVLGKDKVSSGKKKKKKKKKFVTRGEIEKKRKLEIEKEEVEREIKRRKKEEEELKKVWEENKIETKEKDLFEIPILQKDEVIRRLIARGEPITLFAETDLERAERLRMVEIKEPTDVIEGSTNDFQEALEQITKEEDENEEDLLTIRKKQEEEEDPDFKIEDREPEGKEEEILFFFRRVLKEWQYEISALSVEAKKDRRLRREWRLQFATFKQSQVYIRPLFRLLREKSLPPSIQRHIHAIVIHLKNKDYVKANDHYYRMSIGNAPWPLGVTMVGIHERSARERIFSDNVAHVLNDDRQRKYISSIKRLMTFCQKKYPNAPSKSVSS